MSDPKVDGPYQPSSADLQSITKKFHQWAAVSTQEQELKGRKESLRAELLAWAEQYGEANAKGHHTVDLPAEFTVPGGKAYAGWVREKRVSQSLSEDRVRELAEAKGLTDRIFKKQIIEVLDQNELYACEQEGLLTVEELDALVDTHTMYALKAY
ncbi:MULTISPECIES: hypothetical protein [Streptosporangium]|uniref:Uncharacterized protein n=1 Tax=Streptosporangium brasiliense TaxID=47480 RepID=A0ABT9RMX8_9ACTN|nr:hypothetical protein [Streptosporangium brasiliense]MDP9870443.1 hypothetical protein [Streptosporangium brasiliense]